MRVLADRGARMLEGDLPETLPGNVRWLILSNPAFSPELAQLARVLRGRGGGVAAAFETPDFDLGLWATGPLHRHPFAPQGDLLRHVRDLARSIALCDALLATGPAMAARLRARNPAARILTMPLTSSCGAERLATPGRRRRRIVFAVREPADRALLHGYESLLIRAAELLEAELSISESAFLPEALREHPSYRVLPEGAEPDFASGDILFLPPIGDGAWQKMRSGAPFVAALKAGATLWGAIPEQLSIAAAPSHRLRPLQLHWEAELTDAPSVRQRLAMARAELRWRRVCRARRERMAVLSAFAPLTERAG